MLAYPSGSTSVRCSVCMTINQLVQQQQPAVANIRCQGCNTHLMYTSGAPSVRCALCDYVTQTSGVVQPQRELQQQYAPTSQQQRLPR